MFLGLLAMRNLSRHRLNAVTFANTNYGHIDFFSLGTLGLSMMRRRLLLGGLDLFLRSPGLWANCDCPASLVVGYLWMTLSGVVTVTLLLLCGIGELMNVLIDNRVVMIWRSTLRGL
jgi:hypothetical protein